MSEKNQKDEVKTILSILHASESLEMPNYQRPLVKIDNSNKNESQLRHYESEHQQELNLHKAHVT